LLLDDETPLKPLSQPLPSSLPDGANANPIADTNVVDRAGTEGRRRKRHLRIVTVPLIIITSDEEAKRGEPGRANRESVAASYWLV